MQFHPFHDDGTFQKLYKRALPVTLFVLYITFIAFLWLKFLRII